jgi:DNA-binding GntR family transcriptional regulator
MFIEPRPGLTQAYQVSYTVIRAAIPELRAAGLVLGQPGKGVFVRATPDEVAERMSTIDELATQVAELRELCTMEAARLRRQLEALQARITESVNSPESAGG